MSSGGSVLVSPDRDGLRLGQLQPRLTPDATNRLLVDRPALAIQEGPDPPVAVPQVRPASPSIRRANTAFHREGRARIAEAGRPGPARA